MGMGDGSGKMGAPSMAAVAGQAVRDRRATENDLISHADLLQATPNIATEPLRTCPPRPAPMRPDGVVGVGRKPIPGPTFLDTCHDLGYIYGVRRPRSQEDLMIYVRRAFGLRRPGV
jgi:hypothetical protein